MILFIYSFERNTNKAFIPFSRLLTGDLTFSHFFSKFYNFHLINIVNNTFTNFKTLLLKNLTDSYNKFIFNFPKFDILFTYKCRTRFNK